MVVHSRGLRNHFTGGRSTFFPPAVLNGWILPMSIPWVDSGFWFTGHILKPCNTVLCRFDIHHRLHQITSCLKSINCIRPHSAAPSNSHPVALFLQSDAAKGYCLPSILKDSHPDLQLFVTVWSNIIFGISHIFLFHIVLLFSSGVRPSPITSSNILRPSACGTISSGVGPEKSKETKAESQEERKSWRSAVLHL